MVVNVVITLENGRGHLLQIFEKLFYLGQFWDTLGGGAIKNKNKLTIKLCVYTTLKIILNRNFLRLFFIKKNIEVVFHNSSSWVKIWSKFSFLGYRVVPYKF